MHDAFEQLGSAGLQITERDAVFGELARCRVDGDKGSKKSGWYRLDKITVRGQEYTVGKYGNWSRFGDEVLAVEIDLPPLSDEEKREFARRQAELRKSAEEEKAKRTKDAAQRAAKMWAALPDEGVSPYLDRKRVRGFGLRYTKGAIAIPVRNIGGDLLGLQFIQPDGEKKFLTGTPKRGGFHVIGDISKESPIMFAEGYATGASGYMAIEGVAVVIVFDAFNLITVAKIHREHFPSNDFHFLADNDIEKPGWACLDCGHFSIANAQGYTEFTECPKCRSIDCCSSNTGIAKATAAARVTRGRLCVPDFSVTSDDTYSPGRPALEGD